MSEEKKDYKTVISKLLDNFEETLKSGVEDLVDVSSNTAIKKVQNILSKYKVILQEKVNEDRSPDVKREW